MFEDRWCPWQPPSYPEGGSCSSIVLLTSSLNQGFLKMKKDGNFRQVFFCFVNSIISLINLKLRKFINYFPSIPLPPSPPPPGYKVFITMLQCVQNFQGRVRFFSSKLELSLTKWKYVTVLSYFLIALHAAFHDSYSVLSSPENTKKKRGIKIKKTGNKTPLSMMDCSGDVVSTSRFC